MILIADSGSTKTDWCILNSKKVVRQITTNGTNPFFQTPEEIDREIGESLLPALDDLKIKYLHFYGAGCALPNKVAIIRTVLTLKLPDTWIYVNTDILAAARALCGNQPGIACILGTGSNSCYYNGEGVERNIPPLGYILGDEGSGAALGRQLIGDCMKNQLPAKLREAFWASFKLTPTDIMERVYKKPFPNRFLASFTPFLAQHIEEPEIRALVKTGFTAFFRRNVMQYPGWDKLPVHFIGSVAYFFQEVLEEVANELGIKLGIVTQTPMAGLVRYHAIND